MSTLPTHFENIDALEDFMTRPSPALVADLARVDGDLIVLGVGGKMGPTLARLAKRALPGRRVIGVARFTEPGLRQRLEALHEFREPLYRRVADVTISTDGRRVPKVVEAIVQQLGRILATP
jgi:hypothetical protein